jgi:hypothetical protein
MSWHNRSQRQNLIRIRNMTRSTLCWSARSSGFLTIQDFWIVLPFKYYDHERTWWRLLQKHVVRTKFDICIFILFCFRYYYYLCRIWICCWRRHLTWLKSAVLICYATPNIWQNLIRGHVQMKSWSANENAAGKILLFFNY